MKALVVAPYLPPGGGGLERYADEVARRLAQRGHHVTLVGHADAASDERLGGVRRVGVPAAVRLSRTPIHPRFHRVVRGLLLADRFDVVHAHTPVPGAAEMAWWAAERERVPFVVTYHAGALLSGSRAFALPARLHAATIQRAMLAGAGARLAVSRFVSSRVAPDLAWSLAPPGVDAERFRPRGEPVPGRVLFVGAPSRAQAWKGLAILADAIRRLPDARLRIVGDGDLRAKYEAMPRVEVVGRVDDEGLAREYAQASVVALPSLTDAESFGMVLAEANACGRPVVGSRAGGIPCFVRDGVNGFLAPPGNAPALAAALAMILRDPALAAKMGARGRRIVEVEHRWEGVASATLGAYAEAIRAARRLRLSRTARSRSSA